jgi:hypothetical protein
MRRLALILFCQIPIAAAWHFFAPPSSQTVLTEIKRAGAKTYSHNNFDTREWNSALGQIDSGEEQWLVVAHAMAPGTDGDSAEELGSSLAHALLANPAGTLRMFAPHRGTDLLMGVACFSPLQSADDAELARFKAAATKAVAAVDDPELAQVKALCLKQLAKRDWNDL